MRSTRRRAAAGSPQNTSFPSLGTSKISVRGHIVTRRSIALLALLALVAATTLALVIAIDSGSPRSRTVLAPQAAPNARPDNGPSESTIAAAIASRSTRGAVEPQIAPSDRPDGGPSESRIAAAIADGPTRGRFGRRADGGPDESRTAAAIARR